MKTKKLLFAAIIISLLFTFKQSAKAQTGYYSPSLANFDVAMNNLLNNYNLPGGQLAITYKGRLVYSRGFGLADKSTKTVVCPENIFRIASLSKQITAITIMHLYEQGRIGLNDTVFGTNGILKDSIYQTVLDPRVYGITVRRLLSHQGGWDMDISGDPEHNSYAIAIAMAVPPPANNETIIQYTLSKQMLDFTPGTSAKYSNLGFNILGEIIEKITNQNYEIYVRDTILAPLGISDIHSAKSLLINKYPKEVHYYDDPAAPLAPSVFNNSLLVPMQYGGSDCHMEVRAAAGGWVASAQDLCKLLCAVDLYPTKPDILLPATINTMVQPTNRYVYSTPYALGWWINTTDNNWYHSGSLHGTMTYQCRRNDQINYALLVNTRLDDAGASASAINALVRSVVPTITIWPVFDLFDSTIICSPTNSVNKIYINPSLFTVYPNPSNGKFTVKADGLQQANYKLTICNLLGQEIYTSFVKEQQTTADIDLTDFSKGIYFVKFDEGTNSYKQKIIIE
jgi:CubicO group peptidase (beta-lactamase class C family)